MEDKKADNRILNIKSNNIERINAIDDKLEKEREKLKKLDDIEELTISINKRINKCLDLLSKSIAGPNVESTFEDMRKENKNFLNKSNASIEKETDQARKLINGLYKEKEKLISEERNKTVNNKEE